MEDLLQNLDISQEEDDELVFERVTDFESGTVNLEFCLVGRFLTDQSYNFNIMRSRMANIWKPVRGVLFKDIGNGRFLIQFYHSFDMTRILEGGPWSFDNRPLIIHKLQIGDIPTQVELNKLAFWVQIYDIPHGLFTEKVGISLGNFIGKFLDYDDSNRGAAWKPYMRIRVELNVDLPLKRWKKIKLCNGIATQVNFKYERLHTFCFICGKLGQKILRCSIYHDRSDN